MSLIFVIAKIQPGNKRRHNLQIQDGAIKVNTIDKPVGRFSIPTASTVTGPINAQNEPLRQKVRNMFL